MSWPNPFRRNTANTKTCWGYTFELTDKHPTAEQTDPLKYSYDTIAERVLDRLNEISPPAQKQLPRHNSQFTKVVPPELKVDEKDAEAPKIPSRDLYAVLRDNAENNELLSEFWKEINIVPEWVDWAQLERGQDVFYRYGGACLTGLAYQSLLGGMGAARVVETLARTGGFSTKVARGRLYETTQHILQCTKSLESMQPGGDGFASTIRVRLLHAAVRQRIMKLRESKPEYYDVEAWGIPINDLDNLATIATFSATLMYISLPRQGIYPRKQEIADYIALWRYIGHVIGCPPGWFDTPEDAERLMDTLLMNEIQPTETSKILANNVIKSLEGQPPGFASADFLIASARWLNGNDLCDELGLARPSVYYWALMAGQCLFFCFFSYTYRSIPSLDRKKIAMLKTVFYNIIVHTPSGLKGKETTFDFKYVPEYSTITEMGEAADDRATHSHVESRNLKTLLVGAGVMVVGASSPPVKMPPSSQQRREKSKSTQYKSSASTTSLNERPRLKERANSNTPVELRRRDADKRPVLTNSSRAYTAGGAARPPVDVDGQDEDEVAGVVGAIRHFSPFQRPVQVSSSETLPELNVAVIGAANVGKSTFMQHALALPSIPSSQAAEGELPIHGTTYLVRLLKLPIDELDIDDDDTISWPDTIEDKMMPRIDGAVALYDVQDKASIEELPEVLNAISKASVPTILLSCKCDTPEAQREVNPDQVEHNAKRAISTLSTLQVSEDKPDSHQRGIFMLLNSIVSEEHRRSLSSRRRAQTSSLRPTSSNASSTRRGHSRASSDLSATFYKDQRHSRHDSSIAYSTGDRQRAPRTEEQMQGSFLLEESASDASLTSSSYASLTAADIPQGLPPSASATALVENGASFDELVTRLLSQPISKADGKFAAIFLAMYRKFAAPGRLLEAIVEKFDLLERNGSAALMRSVTQLRYVEILEKWVTAYPGDFAYPKTKRRLLTFVGKLAETRVFASAAREIKAGAEVIHADDDTHWAYCDKDREANSDPGRASLSSSASTLIDDPSFTFEQELSGSTINDDVKFENLPKLPNQMTIYVEQAQRQAQTLEPMPRMPLTKIHWRMLMDHPDELIAKELTRMDWIMFSAIRPRDLVRDVSLSKEQKARCKNLAHVNRITDHFNVLARWVANYVLLRDKPKHRAMMLEKFMKIARKVREFNNYSALGAIIAGVKSTSVHRLGQTKELISPATGKDWLKLEILMASSRSYFAYRLAWENSSTERIPYLPLHRRDLVSAEEGNKTFIGDVADGRINWKKFEIMGEVIIGIQRAQGMPYKNIVGSQQIKDLVLDVKLLEDEEELYERSLQCEPAASTSASSGPSSKFKDFFKR
ncbi:unnamed protein product [Zymoseptoria tritici ST99CH_3D7]|uniref:Ras-GEF domain-containing protein n=1 Tax=Zymoseptoria tritici (strain ST99CH_3D7) TaxID=1276538 RepID=A0A1X7RGX6_ZYMT9|nr:unnamed protein product [Zymoseptoria tritici ST99CH_3D7]